MRRPQLRVVGPSEALDRPALQRAFHQGDREAFAQLVAPHLDLLYTHCLRMTGRPADAEDLTQEALVAALREHRRYDPSREFRPWLLVIALNRCRDHLRSVWWRRVFSLEGLSLAHGRDVERELLDADDDARVRAALSTLPVTYREAVSLFHLEDLSYAEMSEITGQSVAALKQRVRRGLAMLAKALARIHPDLVPALPLEEP